MRYIKYGIIIVFLIIAIFFTTNWFKEKNDKEINSKPVIQMDKDIIEASVKDDNAALLKGIVVNDEEDGDITADIIVESISQFIDDENHICNITYAVADSDNNVTKATRKIKFTDYESPKFTLARPLCFDVSSEDTTVGVLGAVDVRDGDISNKIKILASTVYTSTAGEYTFTAQVTNSLGDTSKIKATVIVRQGNKLSPTINLTENITYLKVGDDFDGYEFVSSVEDKDGNKISKDSVDILSSSVDTTQAGTYMVEYGVSDAEGNEGSTYLTVVVEE